MTTLSPRDLPSDSYKRWLKNGAILLWRGWDVWLPLVFLVSLLTNTMSLSSPLVVFGLIGISGCLHGLNMVAAENYSGRKRFAFVELVQHWWQEAQEQRAWWTRSIMLRVGWSAAIAFFLFVLPTLKGHASSSSSSAPANHGVMFWFDFFVPWQTACFAGLIFQAGGVISMHYLLMTRCGVSSQRASTLSHEAFRKNFASLLTLHGVALFLLVVTSALPFLTAPAECFWASTIFCAWNDIFMGKGELEKQEAKATSHQGWRAPASASSRA